MNIKRISKNMTGLVFVLILIVTAAIMLLISDSDTRTRLFWISFGFIIFSELLMGLNFADIAGSGSQKGMPFKVAQGGVSTAYFVFALIMTVLAGNFDSVATYSITQMVPALGVTIFTIAFATAQYARRSSDDASAAGRASKVGIQLLLTDLIEMAKDLPDREELKTILSGLLRISENVRYVAETVFGAEQADMAVVQQIEKIKERLPEIKQVSGSDLLSGQIQQLAKEVNKLEHLFKQREFSIKQLR
jgi:hypothetical protein